MNPSDTGLPAESQDFLLGRIDQLRKQERTPEYAWSELPVGVSVERLQEWPSAGSSVELAPGWIFDHIPKTGGMYFSGLCESRLAPLDHLYTRWPGSWNGVTIGRLLRARLVHGHGARYAAELAPHREWRTAVTVRDPRAVAVSYYQQECRDAAKHGLDTQSLEDWLESWARGVSRPSGAFTERAPDLNIQTRWLAGRRRPVPTWPYYAVSLSVDEDELLETALNRLADCDLVAETRYVEVLFEYILRDLDLPPADADIALNELITNASARPSEDVLSELSLAGDSLLAELTQLDQQLLAQAGSRRGFVTPSVLNA